MTGSAGFIGSHLTDRLLEQGDRVLGIDSFDSYYGRRQKLSNLSEAFAHPRFTLVRGDLKTLRWGRHLSRGTRVYHLAAQPGVRGSWGENFHRYVENNILATQSVFETVAAAGWRNRIVYASSSSIYGEQPAGAMPEAARPNPISPYGMTKLAGEHLARAYAEAYQLPIVSARFFTVYGPRQRPDMAFHRFFGAAMARRPIEVFGTGRQLRDFTYVSDIVDGVVRAAESNTAEPVLNLGRGSPVRLSEAVRGIAEVTGRKLKIVRRALPAGDPSATWADTRLARREIGYRPRVRLPEGLGRQWEWQKRLRGGSSP